MRIRVSRTKSVQNYYILLERANKNTKNHRKMAFFCKKICVYEKIAVLLRPISRSRAVVARQAHNLKVGGSIPSSATKERFWRSIFFSIGYA